MIKTFSNKKGFTILEFILSIFLISILSAGVMILINLYKDYQFITPASISRLIIKKNHSSSLNILKESILQAQSILASTTINGQNYASDNKNLILQLRSVDNNKNIIPGSYDLIIFYTTSTNPMILHQKIMPSPYSSRKNTDLIINKMVKNITFEYNTSLPKDADLIKIYLETSNNLSLKEIIESSYITVKLNK
jgi:prepilin-type N-terminal cleavage/methylation domain-containing protein